MIQISNCPVGKPKTIGGKLKTIGWPLPAEPKWSAGLVIPESRLGTAWGRDWVPGSKEADR